MSLKPIIESPRKKYRIIYADPPWRISKGGKKAVRPNSSGEELDYPVISLDEIQAHLLSATRNRELKAFKVFIE